MKPRELLVWAALVTALAQAVTAWTTVAETAETGDALSASYSATLDLLEVQITQRAECLDELAACGGMP